MLRTTSSFESCPISRSKTVDFKGNDLKNNMAELLAFFDHWKLSRRAQVLTEKENYMRILPENASKIDKLKSQYQYYINKKTFMIATLEKEKKETERGEEKVIDLRAQVQKLKDIKCELERKVIDLQNKIKKEKEKEIKDQYESVKASQLEKETPELEFFQRYLALNLDSLRKDCMKFIFTNVDPEDHHRLFHITIDVSSSNYQVIDSHPHLNHLQDLVEELNDHRNFYTFLKIVRQKFALLVNSKSK